VTPGELTGKVRTHITDVPEPLCALHKHAIAAFLGLRKAALAAGFNLAAHSSFRDFSRQLTIWNEKYTGARPMYDAAGRGIDVRELAVRSSRRAARTRRSRSGWRERRHGSDFSDPIAVYCQAFGPSPGISASLRSLTMRVGH